MGCAFAAAHDAVASQWQGVVLSLQLTDAVVVNTESHAVLKVARPGLPLEVVPYPRLNEVAEISVLVGMV